MWEANSSIISLVFILALVAAFIGFIFWVRWGKGSVHVQFFWNVILGVALLVNVLLALAGVVTIEMKRDDICAREEPVVTAISKATFNIETEEYRFVSQEKTSFPKYGFGFSSSWGEQDVNRVAVVLDVPAEIKGGFVIRKKISCGEVNVEIHLHDLADLKKI
jgi:hypothetical protein